MAGHTLKSLVSRRRRAHDEGEDEEGPVVVADSQSEGSVITDMDSDDGELDESVEGDNAHASHTAVGSSADLRPQSQRRGAKSNTEKRKQRKKPVKPISKDSTPNGGSQPTFKAMADTEAMMNGLKLDGSTQEDANRLPFDSSEPNSVRNGQNGSATASGEQRSKESQDQRRTRETNPTFIPNRGGFYMHDSRTLADSRGPQPGRSQGRPAKARGGLAQQAAGEKAPLDNTQSSSHNPTEGQWRHDLHDTINEEPSQQNRSADLNQDPNDASTRLFGKPAAVQDRQAPPPSISFSSTTLVGKVNLRVSLPGMQAAISYAEVPVKHYTRLPNHRPPLRRDKPVRISIPHHPPRYIFPSYDRSFIFIPRQMRPNQQGFGRYSQQNRSVGGFGYSSRRTSMYGGSVYSASIAPSRRPSMVSQVGREAVFSPVGSVASGYQPNTFRPVVRMPPNLHAQAMYSGNTTPAQAFSGYQTPIMPVMQNYPPPQQPTFQGTPTTNVQHPRPQKAISVSGIDSPALVQQSNSIPPDRQQPFHNQLPAHMQQDLGSGFNVPPSQTYFPPNQGMAYSQSSHIHTPSMGGIPENAVHAPAFQVPTGMPYGQTFYPGQQPTYGQGQGQGVYGFWPQQPAGYPPSSMYPAQREMGIPQPLHDGQNSVPEQPDIHQPANSNNQYDQAPSGFVAYEERGMVFYRPASEAREQGQDTGTYQPAETFTPSYALPPGGNVHPAHPPDGPFFAFAPQDMGAMYYPPVSVDMQGQSGGQQ